MDVIDINFIINDNAVCAIAPASFIIPYHISQGMYEQKDSLKRKSHLKTQQFSIVDITAFDLLLYRLGGRHQA